MEQKKNIRDQKIKSMKCKALNSPEICNENLNFRTIHDMQ